jgi:hypothetical protein
LINGIIANQERNNMESELLVSILTALVSALGLKEIWLIWKKRIELKERKLTKDANTKDKLMAEVILDLKKKIEELETKIDSLIEENTMLREKLARMEERLLISATNRSTRKRRSKTDEQ